MLFAETRRAGLALGAWLALACAVLAPIAARALDAFRLEIGWTLAGIAFATDG